MSERKHNSVKQVKVAARAGSNADLPIFRSWDNSSPNTVNVRDLHRCLKSNAAERGRT